MNSGVEKYRASRLFGILNTTGMTSDSELIERIRRREAEGLALAYDRYGAIAFSVLIRVTRDRAVSEDLLQELFIRVWNRSREFDPARGALGVWIVSIARNMAIDYMRSAQARFHSRLRPLEEVDPWFCLNQSADAETLVDRNRAVAAALATLNENEKKALELAYFDGLSQTEIAAKLQEPLGTVKSWIRSGLGRMRAALKVRAAT